VVEVHLFDLAQNLVGEELSLEFVQYLRAEQKYSDIVALKEQISRDCQTARELLRP
jgi:riboflavin kinase/FMN adenylyltransferase